MWARGLRLTRNSYRSTKFFNIRTSSTKKHPSSASTSTTPPLPAQTSSSDCGSNLNPESLTLRSLESSNQVRSASRMFIQDYLKDVESLKRILIDSVDVSFSRSGGKGGQNVNKVNTKATLKLRIKDLRRSIPNYWIENLTKSHLYAPNSEMVIVQSSSTRSQSLNLRDCWAKIYQTFDSISKIGLIGETDQNKVKRISKLKDISKKRVLIQKQYRKSIKSNRSSPLS